MPINEVTLNIYLLASILGLSVLIGFALRANMVKKCRDKIEELEREILSNYEHILELEREALNTESTIQDAKIPVIAMKSPAKEMEVVSKKVPDISLRKQLLSKEKNDRQSASGL